MVLTDLMRELAALEEPSMRQANERRADDHGVNLAQLRAAGAGRDDEDDVRSR